MDKQQYDTIKLQINQEKEHILKEVYELTAEKRKIEQKKEYDLYVVKSRSKVVRNWATYYGWHASFTYVFT